MANFDNRWPGAILRGVLKEMCNVRQERPSGRRRWFDDDLSAIELIVWYDAAEKIDGFQLCYDLGGGEHALTWRPKVGFTHNAIDAGSEEGPFKNLTPVLVPVGSVPWAELVKRFAGSSASLEPPLRELVATRLNARN